MEAQLHAEANLLQSTVKERLTDTLQEFRITHEAIGMLLRDLDHCLDAHCHGNRIYVIITTYKLPIRRHIIN